MFPASEHANGHQADDPNNPGFSEEPKTPAIEQDAPVQLAFGFALAPQDDGHRTPWLKRIQQSGLSCYWDIYQALLDSPPAWETKFWPDHPNRRREWPKKALYIAWSAAPSGARQPRTQGEFAEAIGVTPQAIWKWKANNPEMTDFINELALAPLEAAIRDVDYVTLWQAQQLDSPIAARKLFYERAAEIRAARQPDNPQVTQILQMIFNNLDISRLDPEQLARLAAGEDPLKVLAGRILDQPVAG